MVRFGPKCERGCLPVFSVADDEEARELLNESCPKNGNRPDEWVAPELHEEQTLTRLFDFSDRLAKNHERLREKGLCRCAPVEETPPKKRSRKK